MDQDELPEGDVDGAWGWEPWWEGETPDRPANRADTVDEEWPEHWGAATAGLP